MRDFGAYIERIRCSWKEKYRYVKISGALVHSRSRHSKVLKGSKRDYSMFRAHKLSESFENPRKRAS